MRYKMKSLFKQLAGNADLAIELREKEDLNSGKLRLNVTAQQINLARRIVKSVIGISYLTGGGHFITASIAFQLAHLVLVARNTKVPYAIVVKNSINYEWRKNKTAYKRIAAIVDKISYSPLQGHDGKYYS